MRKKDNEYVQGLIKSMIDRNELYKANEKLNKTIREKINCVNQVTYESSYKRVQPKSDYEKMQELANKVLEENRVKVEKESKDKELLEWAKMIVKDKEE